MYVLLHLQLLKIFPWKYEYSDDYNTSTTKKLFSHSTVFATNTCSYKQHKQYKMEAKMMA